MAGARAERLRLLVPERAPRPHKAHLQHACAAAPVRWQEPVKRFLLTFETILISCAFKCAEFALLETQRRCDHRVQLHFLVSLGLPLSASKPKGDGDEAHHDTVGAVLLEIQGSEPANAHISADRSPSRRHHNRRGGGATPATVPLRGM
jgi:hypothetical protein